MKTITVCSSASFYKQVLEIKDQLEEKGFKVLVPKNAKVMLKMGNFDVNFHKSWYKNPDDYHKKTKLMMGHFKEVAKGDVILVVNLEKHGIKGYIGGNVLMEMALAFYLKKKIYVLNEVNKDSSFYEEIMGLGSVVLNGNLLGITK